jgi:hypothetical protein
MNENRSDDTMTLIFILMMIMDEQRGSESEIMTRNYNDSHHCKFTRSDSSPFMTSRSDLSLQFQDHNNLYVPMGPIPDFIFA